MKQLTTKDGVDAVIQAQLKNESFETTPALKEIMARYGFIFGEIQTYRQSRPDLPAFKIRRAIISRVTEDFGVSLSQASFDYEMVCEKYQIENVGFELQYTLRSALKDIEEDMDAAREAGAHDALTKFHRAKAEYIKLLPKEKVDLATLPFPEIRMVFDPELVNSSVKGISLKQLYEWVDGVIAKEKKSMSDVFIGMAETTEFEEIDE